MKHYPESFNTRANNVVNSVCYCITITNNKTGYTFKFYTPSERQCKIYQKQYNTTEYTATAAIGSLKFKTKHAYPKQS